MTKQYAIAVLGQHLGSVWADKVVTGDSFGSDPNDLWFSVGGEAVLIMKPRPGIEVSTQDGPGNWVAVTPDTVRAEMAAKVPV